MKGAPLRFAAMVIGGWVVIRIVVLLPVAVPLVPPVLAAQRSRVVKRVAQVGIVRVPDALVRDPVRESRSAIMDVTQSIAAAPKGPTETASIQPTPPVASDRFRPAKPVAVETAASLLPTSSALPSRLSIDVWLVARPGGGDNLAFGQLGASQGGARLTFALDRHMALSGRASTPLRGAGREIGIGIDLKLTRLPIHLLVEQRIDFDKGTTRPAVIAIAGGSTALPWQARIDAFSQAGAVHRRGGFADGALLVTRPIRTHGNTRIEVGGGIWGAAQRGVTRVDVGPSIALVTPGAGGMLRLQFDYRARIVGRARPGSGPALTLGGSF